MNRREGWPYAAGIADCRIRRIAMFVAACTGNGGEGEPWRVSARSLSVEPIPAPHGERGFGPHSPASDPPLEQQAPRQGARRAGKPIDEFRLDRASCPGYVYLGSDRGIR